METMASISTNKLNCNYTLIVIKIYFDNYTVFILDWIFYEYQIIWCYAVIMSDLWRIFIFSEVWEGRLPTEILGLAYQIMVVVSTLKWKLKKV